MLKGISPAVSPDLLKILCEMGHGDEIVLADSNFPGASIAKRFVRADGLPIKTILEAILPLFVLDRYADPLIMMQVVSGDKLDPAVEADYMQVVRRHQPDAAAPVRVERNAFYERASHAFCVVMTGELRVYGNLILKKGVIT
ncbi:MAG: L-fucose mutarotase [Acidobacteriaceae bacterium]